MADIAPATVLDAGCAMGFLVEALRDQGVDAFGIDVSEYGLSQARADIRPFCRQDSVTEPFPRRFDLIVCIEVLEHLPAADAPRAVQNIAGHSDDVLFSSTPDDYREATHFNVQPPEFWAELFAREDMYRDVDYDASYITPWAVRFRRRRDPPARQVAQYERLVRRLVAENRALRELTLERRTEPAPASAAPDGENAAVPDGENDLTGSRSADP